MAYKLGFCAQCDKQILVKNSSGRVASVLPIYRQVDVVFDDGHRMRAPVCKDCAMNPDFKKIIENVTADGSEAFGNRTRDKILEKTPISVGLANALQGVSLGEK